MHSPPPYGPVFLVGAGPGDPGLLTVRGLLLLQSADVVVYDFLIDPGLLKEAPVAAERLYVGKRGRSDYIPQSEINAILIEKAKAGKRVVRLKGGDPFLFGRGGEEALALKTAGIFFEVVPGVSSATAVSAYAGIPLTDRDCATSVILVSGYEAKGKPAPAVDWSALAKSSGTLVVFMGVSRLTEITGELLKGGMKPETPAALIQWGTRPFQKTAVATLATIVQVVEQAGLRPPALLVIGQVVSLRGQLNWFEEKPLFGKRVVLTRGEGEARESARLLSERGAQVIEFPTIEILPPESFEAFDRSLDRRKDYDWVLFTSGHAVESFFTRLFARGMDVRALGDLKIGVVGEKTALKLRDYGLVPDAIPEDTTQEGLLEILKKKGIAKKSVWFPAASEVRPVLAQGLRELKCEVDHVPVYRTVCPKAPAIPPNELFSIDQPLNWVLFTSASTVKNFVTLVGSDVLKALVASGTKFAAIGPIVQKTLQTLKLPCHVVPKVSTIEALIGAIGEFHD